MWWILLVTCASGNTGNTDTVSTVTMTTVTMTTGSIPTSTMPTVYWLQAQCLRTQCPQSQWLQASCLRIYLRGPGPKTILRSQTFFLDVCCLLAGVRLTSLPDCRDYKGTAGDTLTLWDVSVEWSQSGSLWQARCMRWFAPPISQGWPLMTWQLSTLSCLYTLDHLYST